MKPCVLIGQSIESLTAAVALASLGHQVVAFGDLVQVAQTHAFEHELVALYRLYVASGQIVEHKFGHWQLSQMDGRAELYWLFVSDELFVGMDVAKWLGQFNQQNTNTPIVLSGSDEVGFFESLSLGLVCPFVYYLPFVFLEDGRAFASMLGPKLWLVGTKTADSLHHIAPLGELGHRANESICSDIKTVEFARMSIMTMLAVRVSLLNELSCLADGVGVDITQVSAMMGKDERIGTAYLQAGSGFGGKTLPKEVDNTLTSFGKIHQTSQMIRAVSDINTSQKELMFRKFWQYFNGFIDDKTVMIWGGGYKSGSGRTINSAIHPLLRLFWSYRITTYVAADLANDELARLYADEPYLQIAQEPYAKLAECQALFVLNAQDRLDITKINDAALPVFDGGNVLDRRQIEALVGGYWGVGRQK